MKIFNYKGLSGFDSKCGWVIIPQQNAGLFVVLTELGDNPGTSITNFYDKIATKIYQQHLFQVPICNIRWIEHYDESSYHFKTTETFTEITLKKDIQGCFTLLERKHCDEVTSKFLRTFLSDTATYSE